MSPEPFRNQKYSALKKQLIKEGKLFTDVEFPPADSSLYMGLKSLGDNIEWKRPGDIVKDPRLIVDGVGFNDVLQGILGNCWFVSACSALTHHKTLWTKVISDVDEQEWDNRRPERYCGIFHFCFWRFGRWIDVVVDDLLPTRNNELIFAKSKTPNEFWSALLEKAFAKLNGCYESLIGGTLTEAFVDITGGVPETITITSNAYKESLARSELFTYLKDAHDQKALMATAIVARTAEEIEQHLECGLVKGHSYAISAIKRLALDAQNTGLLSSLFSHPDKIMMVRLQNPWGQKEWNGPWSDGSPEWQQISKQQQNDLGLRIDEDGQFWMTWEDFCRYFTDISVCHQINTKFFTMGKRRYTEKIFQGIWQSGPSRGHYTDRAGGCMNFKESCLCNPQYRFDVDEDGREVVVSLMQRDIRERRRQGASYLTIGMTVQRVEENRVYRLHQSLDVQATSDYVNTRSVFLRMKNLKKGRYIVIPTTYAPGEEGEFMLRMYTMFPPNAEEMLNDLCDVRLTRPMFRSSSSLTSIETTSRKLKHAERPVAYTRLRAFDAVFTQSMLAVNPYCIVKCEGKSFRSHVCKESISPLWDLSLIFVRKHVEKPITVDIWSSNMLKDTFLGRAMVECPVNNEISSKEIALIGDKKVGDQFAPMPGKLKIEVATYDNPIHL